MFFQEKVDDLLTIEEAIEMDLRSLETSVYSNNTFHEILNKIQKAVDDLSLNAYRHNHLVVPSYQFWDIFQAFSFDYRIQIT